MSEYLNLYKKHDTSFVVNVNDRDLTPVLISLPEPPDLHLIDGYGLHPDEQYFKRKEIPDKLKELERRVYREIEDENSTNHNKAVNGYTITKRFWDEVSDNIDDYKEELKFLNDFWWWSIYGYWFFNDGKPTYVPPKYFHFLNTFRIPDVRENDGYPEYRDKDLRKYLAMHYLKSTDETFAHRDPKTGEPIKVGGKYLMRKLGKTLFFGTAEPKYRRTGATIQGVHDG